jgi:tetraacyldisaccharide 4'-kinase
VIPGLDEQLFLKKLKPLPHQKVYFSYIEESPLQPLTTAAQAIDTKTIRSVISVSGIANPYLFLDYINHKYGEKEHLTFSDHHVFKKSDIEKIIASYDRIIMRNRAIITTEKDAIRMKYSEFWQHIAHLPVLAVPIIVTFHAKYKKAFDNQIISFLQP